ncbi:hypothetical protein EK904_010406, partial [Melospiza melodia maxima]
GCNKKSGGDQTLAHLAQESQATMQDWKLLAGFHLIGKYFCKALWKNADHLKILHQKKPVFLFNK